MLDLNELPKSLKVDRWSKEAREGIGRRFMNGSNYWDPYLVGRYATLVYLLRQVCQYSYRDEEDYNHMVQIMTAELSQLKVKHGFASSPNVTIPESENAKFHVEDPLIMRTKGCNHSSIIVHGRHKRVKICSEYVLTGHNKKICTNISSSQNNAGGSFGLDVVAKDRGAN